MSTVRRNADIPLTRVEMLKVVESLITQQHRIEQLETEVILLRRELSRHTADK